jgi:hypothetical protein
MIFDKPAYNRGYDTWCPGNSFTDFIVADWVVQKQPGYKQKNNILTFYTPLAEVERKKLLKIDDCRQIAASVLRDFQKLLPEFAAADPVEVHFYRRGHPMFAATPGTFTKIIPAASEPLERGFSRIPIRLALSRRFPEPWIRGARLPSGWKKTCRRICVRCPSRCRPRCLIARRKNTR